jgi:high affinity sulfate transporter 1
MRAIDWLASYDPRNLRPDVVAGVTLAAYILPSAIADASLAGLPPEAGLYACMFGGLAFWVFCSSRHTAVAATSAISLLVGTSLGDLAGGDSQRFAALAMGLALLVGLMAIVSWAVKAGAIVNFVSETVLLGFKGGIAFVLASTQIPKLFGFPGGEGGFWPRMAHIVEHIGETHALSLGLGLVALVALLLGKRVLPGRPVALGVVATGIAATTILDLGAKGVRTLGAVPQGLPPFGLPGIGIAEFDGVVPIALACFLLASVETAAIGRMFALKHGYRFDPNRELLAIGSANLVAGLGHGFPISGGMSQSLVNESGGAKTPLSGLVSAVIIVAVTVGFSGVLRDLPQPVLAAIVMAAITGLVNVDAMARLWRFSPAEFGIAGVAFLGVLGQGILRGVLLGALLSILLLLRRGAQPLTAELGRVGQTDLFPTLTGGPDRARLPGVFIFRSDGALLYFNVDYVRDRFFELLDARPDRVDIAVYFLGTVPAVDLAGADMLIELRHALKARGVELRLAGAHAAVRESLVRAGLDAAAVHAYPSVAAAVGD